MTLDPGPPRRNPSCGLDPARRPGPPALPGITRPKSKKTYRLGLRLGGIFPGDKKYRKLRFQIFPAISDISKILENVADLVVHQIIKYDAVRN